MVTEDSLNNTVSRIRRVFLRVLYRFRFYSNCMGYTVVRQNQYTYFHRFTASNAIMSLIRKGMLRVKENKNTLNETDPPTKKIKLILFN